MEENELENMDMTDIALYLSENPEEFGNVSKRIKTKLELVILIDTLLCMRENPEEYCDGDLEEYSEKVEEIINAILKNAHISDFDRFKDNLAYKEEMDKKEVKKKKSFFKKVSDKIKKKSKKNEKSQPSSKKGINTPNRNDKKNNNSNTMIDRRKYDVQPINKSTNKLENKKTVNNEQKGEDR